MSRETFIKLDNKLIKVSLGPDDKLTAILASDEDLFETSIFSDGVQKALENNCNKLTNEVYEELKDDFKRGVKNAVLRTLGFEQNSWKNEWSVDHCNGRSSIITEYLSEQVKHMFRTEVDPLFKEMLPFLMKKTEISIKKEFEDVWLREARDYARSSIKEEAKNYLRELFKTEIQKYQQKSISTIEASFLDKPNTRKQAVKEEL